jgi:hypothetical protein
VRFSFFKRLLIDVNITTKNFVEDPIKYDDLVAEQRNLVRLCAFSLSGTRCQGRDGYRGKAEEQREVTQTLEVLKISRRANADLDRALSGLSSALAHMPSRLRDMVRMVNWF